MKMRSAPPVAGVGVGSTGTGVLATGVGVSETGVGMMVVKPPRVMRGWVACGGGAVTAMKVVRVELKERGAGGLAEAMEGMEVQLVMMMLPPLGVGRPVPMGTGTEAMDGGVVATVVGAG